MNNYININPSPEEIEKLLTEYKNQENQFPKAPIKINKLHNVILTISIIVISIPALLLLILRIPFIIIRKLRVKYLEKMGAFHFKENTEWDPDTAGREYYFIEPTYKQTPKEKRLEKEKESLRQKTNDFKEEWLKEPSKLNILLDNAAYESVVNYYSGRKLALYIFHQLKELPHQPILKYDILYWNLCVLMSKLQLPNQSEHFKKIAIENGFKSKEQSYNYNALWKNPLVYEVWNNLYRDIINCWP